MLNKYQIKIDGPMESLLTETVLDLYRKARDTRAKKNYGKDSKGAEYTFEDNLKGLTDMFYGNRPPKSVPWKNCSNRSMKISMAIVEMLHARMFPAVWNEDLVRYKKVEKTDKETADRISKLMDWWLRVHMKARNFFDKWCKVNLGYGDVLTECGWDIKLRDVGKVKITPVTDEFGGEVYEKDGTPSTIEEKELKKEETTKLTMVPRQNVYFQEGQTDIEEDPVIIECKWSFADLEELEADGKAVNVVTPFHEGNDVLRAKIEDVVSRELEFSSSKNVETLREVKLRGTDVDIIKCYLKIDIDGDGFAEDVRVIVDPLHSIYLGGVAVKDLSKRGKRPLDFTKVNDLIDRPDDLEGYGFLDMIRPLSEEIDAIFNQLTDANTLGVLRPGFYDPGGSLVPQNILIAPNVMIPVPDPQRNIYFPDFQVPVERLLLAMRTVLEFIERLTGASSYVMGKESEIVGGSGTATRTQAIVGAAEQRFAMPAQRLREGAARIVTMILDQIQLNIPQGLESRILGEDGEPLFGRNELTEEGISGELDAYLLRDPAMGSASVERELAMFLYNILVLQGNPIVATDPMKIYKETANLIRAYGQDPEEHLGKMPEEKDIDTPEEENTLIFQGDFSKVRALITENHLQHIQAHQAALQSPTFAMVSVDNPEAAQKVQEIITMHIQEHTALMQQMLQITMRGGNGQSGQGPGQGAAGASGMESIQGPFGAVAKTKEQGTSNPNTSM